MIVHDLTRVNTYDNKVWIGNVERMRIVFSIHCNRNTSKYISKNIRFLIVCLGDHLHLLLCGTTLYNKRNKWFSILHIFLIAKERIEHSYSLNNTLLQKLVPIPNKIIWHDNNYSNFRINVILIGRFDRTTKGKWRNSSLKRRVEGSITRQRIK